MVLGTRGGYIQVVGWDGTAKICIDALATNAAQANNEEENRQSVNQVVSSKGMGLLAIVFGDGKVCLCYSELINSRGKSGGGVSLIHAGTKILDQATRVSFNDQYRLVAVGLESGDVVVYRVDIPPSSLTSISSPRCSLLRRYSISNWGFRPSDVGRVESMEWSPDGSVIAVGWANRGLVIWSTGGTRVACTLPMLSTPHHHPHTLQSPNLKTYSRLTGMTPSATPHPSATPLPSTTPYPSATPLASDLTTSLTDNSSSASQAPPTELLGTGVTSLAWGTAGCSLIVSSQCRAIEHGCGGNKKMNKSWDEVVDEAREDCIPLSFPVLPSSESRCACGLVTRLSLVHSALSHNPSQNESTSLALLGDDRLVVWAGKRYAQGMDGDETESANLDDEESIAAANWVAVQGSLTDTSMNGTSDASDKSRRRKKSMTQSDEDRFLDSDGDWEHIPLPSVYLSHAWPIQLLALSTGGNQIACAGNQGFICYNRLSTLPSDRKWRRFGNMNHESQVTAKGLAWYGEHIICVASRGKQEAHQIQNITTTYTPPPPASARGKSQPKHVATDPSTDDDIVELLFYPRNHLDNSSLLHTHVLTGARSFRSIDIFDHTLLVYLSVGQMLVYQLRAEIHPATGRTPSITQQQMLLSKLGVGFMPGQPQVYSTLPNAHENIGVDQELRMTLDLAYVVDLCAPLRPVQPLPATENESLTSFEDVLSAPPLQVRLWLSAADGIDGTNGNQTSNSHTYPSPTAASTRSLVNSESSSFAFTHSSDSLPSHSAASSQPSSSQLSTQVYELPLFCPNILSQGLEALHHATAKGKKGGKNSTQLTTAQEDMAAREQRGLSCIILTATGMLLAVDIGPRKSLLNRSPSPFVSTPSITPSPLATPSTVSSPHPTTPCALARVVSSHVEQFWLHEMSSPEPLQAAAVYLKGKRIHGQRGASVDGKYDGQRISTLSDNPSISPSISPPSFSPSPKSIQSNRRLRGLRLFSYGTEGLKVWFRLPSSTSAVDFVSPSSSVLVSSPSHFQSTSLLDFDAEVYPLGFDSNIGVIVGITKGLRTKLKNGLLSRGASTAVSRKTSEAAWVSENERRINEEDEEGLPSPFWGPIVCFRLQTKLQPYLHGVLMHLIADEESESINNTVIAQNNQQQLLSDSVFSYAYQLANSCRSHSYFRISLELLLHTALNPPSSSLVSKFQRTHTLRRVVHFLRLFPEFPDVVMSCARKNDSSCWGRLFAEAGKPTELFQLCLERGKLRMASCYLVLIQRTDGMLVAREYAKKVLEKMGVHDDTAVAQLLPAFSSPPSLPPPSRSRRFSALEGELRRYIALTYGMEVEEKQQQEIARATEVAKAEEERRKKEAREGKVQLGYVPPHTYTVHNHTHSHVTEGSHVHSQHSTPSTTTRHLPTESQQPVMGAATSSTTSDSAPPQPSVDDDDGGCSVM